jgi:hypothetical protein
MGLPDAENPNPQRVPDYTETSEAFTLHLIGYATEELRIPSLLNDEQWPVVRIETHDNAVDYYAAIREMVSRNQELQLTSRAGHYHPGIQ